MILNRNMMSFVNKICLILIVISFLFYLEINRIKFQSNSNYKNLTNNSVRVNKKKIIDFLNINKNKQKINIFDLSQKLTPESVYNPIKCRKSGVYIVSTHLCVHNVENDMHVSGSIMNNGAWEAHILSPFTKCIRDNPDWLVLDVGAQIGQYSFKYVRTRKIMSII